MGDDVAAYVEANSASALVAFRLTQNSVELQAMSTSWEREWRIAVADIAHQWDRDQAIILAGMVMGMISAGLGIWLDRGASGDLRAMVEAGFSTLESGWGHEPANARSCVGP